MQSVLRNAVYHQLEEIVRRFGNAVGIGQNSIINNGVILMGSRNEVSIDNNGDRLHRVF